MTKTSEGVVFAYTFLSPCPLRVRMLLTQVEARWSSFVCPTLLMHPQLWPEILTTHLIASEARSPPMRSTSCSSFTEWLNTMATVALLSRPNVSTLCAMPITFASCAFSMNTTSSNGLFTSKTIDRTSHLCWGSTLPYRRCIVTFFVKIAPIGL